MLDPIMIGVGCDRDWEVASRGEMTEEKILEWADTYFKQTGDWPRRTHGEIPGSDGESWSIVHDALVQGLRGFSGGSSLARLLAEHRGARNHLGLPRLSLRQILVWADVHFERYGRWPICRCLEQNIEGTSGQHWFNVDQCLRKGLRGLRGGSSLARVLARYRGVRKEIMARRSMK